MRGKGTYDDYAVAELFFHTVKTEVLYFEDYQTRAEARASNFEYIEVLLQPGAQAFCFELLVTYSF